MAKGSTFETHMKILDFLKTHRQKLNLSALNRALDKPPGYVSRILNGTENRSFSDEDYIVIFRYLRGLAKSLNTIEI